MELKADEIKSIKTIGKLHGDDVKLILTNGGFFIAVGKKSKGSQKPDSLAAGSHQAIVSHQIEKTYGKDFEPAIFKSESENMGKLEIHTDVLSPDLVKNGVEIFSITKFNKIDFIAYRYGSTLAKYETEFNSKELTIKSHHINGISQNDELFKGIAMAMKKKMNDLGIYEAKGK
jgi:hypothetical protein